MYEEFQYWLAIACLTVIAISWAYSRGWKDGHSEGYVRGRSIASALKEIKK
jgi:hypothetical protein